MKLSKKILSLILALSLILSVSIVAVATTGKVNITVEYSGIKLNVDGQQVVPKDVNGNVVEPFIYNGTTYLPVRALATALGNDVTWDGNTQTVIVKESTSTSTTSTPIPYQPSTPAPTNNSNAAELAAAQAKLSELGAMLAYYQQCLAEANTALENAQKERTIKQLQGDQWVWVADPEEVAQAQENVDFYSILVTEYQGMYDAQLAYVNSLK
jgi:hypothetical protein